MSTKPASSTQPKRYLEIANSLIREISDGRYAVGSLLPTENELAELNAASRQTVRAALRLLQDRGYISRKKAVGTRVESINPSSAYLQSVDTIEDLVRVAATEIRAIESIEVVTLDRSAARRLGAPLGSEWIRLTGPRTDVKKNTPFSWAAIYIDVAFNKIIPKIKKYPNILVSTMIEREFGRFIAEIRQTVFGTLIDDPTAKALGVPPGGAGLRILRHYKDSSQKILEITETIYPAERVSVSFQLRRGGAHHLESLGGLAADWAWPSPGSQSSLGEIPLVTTPRIAKSSYRGALAASNRRPALVWLVPDMRRWRAQRAVGRLRPDAGRMTREWPRSP